jgi:hypothetical protein
MTRESRRPSKQILWLWVADLMKESEGFQLGLDIACGYVKNKPPFRTQDYFGIDASEERIRTGSAETGGKGMACKIEDMPADLKGDFVVCLETTGVNEFFEDRNAALAFEKCVQATNPGGSLLVNVGARARSQFDAIRKIAHDNFGYVDIRDCGRGFEKRSWPLCRSAVVLLRPVPCEELQDPVHADLLPRQEACRLIVHGTCGVPAP